MEKTKVFVYGCGVMGQKIVEALLQKETLQIVGAIDVADDLVNRDLGSLLNPPRDLGVVVRKDAEALLQEVRAHAVVLTTTSHLSGVFPQIQHCVKAGLNVVSTCEELSYPWKRSPSVAQEIDNLARGHGVTVVGTGINPGFLMDLLPLCLTGPCLKVDAIKVTRMMNSAKRRIPFQEKVGTGLTPEDFERRIRNGIITGHVGLLESINMIAGGLGWELDETKELPPEPVVAHKEMDSGLGLIKTGEVTGLVSVAYGKKGQTNVITLEFNAHAGVEEEYDEIVIDGIPRIHQKIIGGVHGDIGTVAMTINTIPKAVQAPAGLLCMKDLPPVSAVP